MRRRPTSDAERELLGILPPRTGEDPRWGGDPNGIDLVSNGAFVEVENLAQDFRDPVDVEADPFMPQVADDDGVPGFRPYVEASKRFTEADLDLRSDGDFDVEDREPPAGGDDFAEIVGHRAAAAVGEDGRPVSDLTRLARAEQAQAAQIAERAPFRRINPISAYTGLLGGQATVRPGQSPVQVINWVGEDVEACPVTITLKPINSVTTFAPVLGTSNRGYAVISWGTRDGQQTAYVDIGTGVQLTIVGSVVTVSLGLDSAANVPLSLSASLGFYPCVRTEPLTFTSYVNSIAQNETVTLYRPTFASHVWFYQPNIANSYVLSFLDYSANNIYVARLNSAGTAPVYTETPIKLSNDCVALNVTNLGANTTIGRVIWGLYL